MCALSHVLTHTHTHTLTHTHTRTQHTHTTHTQHNTHNTTHTTHTHTCAPQEKLLIKALPKPFRFNDVLRDTEGIAAGSGHPGDWRFKGFDYGDD